MRGWNFRILLMLSLLKNNDFQLYYELSYVHNIRLATAKWA